MRTRRILRSAAGRAALPVLLLAVLLPGRCERGENEALDWMRAECLDCEVESELALCYDGQDNDEDGLTDCDDVDCMDVGCCGRLGTENTDDYCKDGCDNDGNGYVDCADYGCTKYTPAVTVCKSPTKEPETTPVACSDGIDNDWNGYFDCNDFSCSESPEVPFCEGNDATCSDGIDNDGDGFVDCKDFSCGNAPICE
jgi:hypothetical protein